MRVRDWVTELVGLAALVVSVLVIGGALRWTQAIVAVLVATALIPLVISKRVLGRPSPLVAVIGIGIALTILQLVPLPSGLLEKLNPTGVALREDGATLLGLSTWSSISMDPAATLRSLAFLVTVLGIAIVALRTAVSERGRYRILAGVAGLCGVTALIVWTHELFGASAVYGIYEPTHANPHLRGPLLNLNHLGCLMAVGAMLGLGLVMHLRQPTWLRLVWVAVIAACGSLTVATVSRGATLALVLGTLVVAALLVGQRLGDGDRSGRRRGDVLTKSLPLAIVSVCTVLVMIYSSAGNVEREIERTSLSELQRSRTKFAAWKASKALVDESPWVGTGRGAFETAFTRVYPDAGFSTFAHTENVYLQSVIDWGIPGGLAIGGALFWFFLVAFRRWRDGPLAAGALGALAVVAIQSNVDFGIELLALAAPVTAIAATVAYVPLREAKSPLLARAGALRIGHIIALGICAAVLLMPMTRSVTEDHLDLDETSDLPAIKAALERHPLDYYGYAQAAQQLARAGDRNSIQLLNHALRLHPTHPGLHRMAARMLLRDGYTAQAALEMAEAIRVGGSPQKLLSEIVTLFKPEVAETAIPIDYPHLDQIIQILEELKRRDLALRWLARVRKGRAINEAYLCELIYAVALRDQTVAAIDTAAATCGDLLPDRHTRLDIVSLLGQKQAHAQIVRLIGDIEDWVGTSEAKARGWLALCDAHLGLGKLDDARRCLDRLRLSGRPPGEVLDQIEVRIGRIDLERAKAAEPTPEPKPTPETKAAPTTEIKPAPTTEIKPAPTKPAP